MSKKYAILSDIHGNLSALEAVMDNINKQTDITGLILLGDLIDYGMRSNEVILYLIQQKHLPIIANIWGNHENAILGNDFGRFSTERGRQCALYTQKILSKVSIEYLSSMSRCGSYCFMIGNFKCLAVHGSQNDVFWRSISPENVNGYYSEYDIVFSGHSHLPHIFHQFYDSDNKIMRNKKSTLFINPGSVGQPRNHNPNSQFSVLDIDTLSVSLNSVPYNVKLEQSLYPSTIDNFYRERLERGV